MKYRVKQMEIRQCRVCGCTNYHACLGGCYWVEKDLCSKCGEKLHKSEAENRNASSMTCSFVLPKIDPSMQLVIIDPKGRLPKGLDALLIGEADCGHTISMAEYLDSLSPSERKNCIIINPDKEFQLFKGCFLSDKQSHTNESPDYIVMPNVCKEK